METLEKRVVFFNFGAQAGVSFTIRLDSLPDAGILASAGSG
jgi:hypothetical protein